MLRQLNTDLSSSWKTDNSILQITQPFIKKWMETHTQKIEMYLLKRGLNSFDFPYDMKKKLVLQLEIAAKDLAYH